MTYNVVFGIDVSSKSSTVSVLIKRNEFKHFTIANDLVGFNELLEQLQCYKHPVVIFEATGVYSLPLQSFLDHHNYDYTRINPLSAKKLMDNNLRHLKTDRTDAHNLAKIQFDVPQPLTPKQDYRYHEMQNASRFYEELTRDLVKYKNRLHRALQSTFPQIEQISSSRSGEVYWHIIDLFPHAKFVLDSSYDQIASQLVKIKGIGASKANQVACSLQSLAQRTWYYDDCDSITVELIKYCIEHLLQIEQRRKHILAYIKQIAPNPKDVQIYLSVPGIGKTTDGFTKIEIPLSAAQTKALQNGNNSFSAAIFDNATNSGTASGKGLKPGATSFGLVLAGGQLPDKITSHIQNYDDERDQFTFKGTFPSKVYGTYTDASGEQHDLPIDYDNSNNEFTAKLPVSRKDYKTTVKLYTDADHQTQLYAKQIVVSVLPAKIKSLKVDGTATFTAGKNEKPNLGETSENTVTISGSVSADTSKVTLTNGSHTVNATVNAENHTFSARVPVSFGDNKVVVTAADADGNSSSVTQVVNSSDRGATTVAVSDIHFDNSISFRGNTVNASTKNYDPKTGKLTITGKLARPTTTLTIAGQEVKAKADGSFSVTLNVGKHGRVVFPVFVGDITQSTVLQDRLEFDVDSEVPVVTINGKHEIDTNKNQYTIEGTITDDHLAYNLFINGNQVEDGADDVNYNDNTKLNKKFKEVVDLKPGENTFNTRREYL